MTRGIQKYAEAFLGSQRLDKATNWKDSFVSRITQNAQIGFSPTRVGIMKFVRCLLAAALLLAGVGASHATVRIVDDRGGQIGGYINKFERLRSSGQSVIIDGVCASACTIVLGAVPRDKICVTSHA